MHHAYGKRLHQPQVWLDAQLLLQSISPIRPTAVRIRISRATCAHVSIATLPYVPIASATIIPTTGTATTTVTTGTTTIGLPMPWKLTKRLHSNDNA